LTIVDNLHPLIPRKELITVKTIRATAGIEKIKTEISKPSRLRQTPSSNQSKTAMESLKNNPLSSAVIKSSCWPILGGGGRSAMSS